MGLSSKRARKVRSVSEDGSEVEDRTLLVDASKSDHDVDQGDGRMDDGGDEEEEDKDDEEDVSDEDEDASSGEEEEGDEEYAEEQIRGREDDEMKELEKEYIDLRNQEQ